MKSSENLRLTKKQWKKIELIPGWLDFSNAEFMYQLTKNSKILGGGNVLEIGSFFGKSATCLGYGLNMGETISVIDPFGTIKFDDTDFETDDQNTLFRDLTLKKFKNFYAFSHKKSACIHIGLSKDILPKLKGEYKLCHIDGGHSYQVVKQDISDVLKLLSKKSLIIFDDYENIAYPGVKKAVDEFILLGILIPIINLGKLYVSKPDFTEELVEAILNNLSGFKVDRRLEIDLLSPKLEVKIKYEEPRSYPYIIRRILTAYLSRI
jgi:hypothetical protein